MIGKQKNMTADPDAFELETEWVWYARFPEMAPALQRERTIKGWPRQWKINLIEEHNRFWDDLSRQLSEYGW